MNRVGVLDGLRAIAVVIVMASHAGLGHIIPGGFGVTIFFFLSGYLITSLMVLERSKTGTVSLRGFYLRRTVRILPPMVLCIVTTIVLTGLNIQPDLIRYGSLVWDFTFLSNYSNQLGTSSGLPIPLWSLCVEEHFYLLFPVLFLVCMRLPDRRGIVVVITAIIVVVLMIRFASWPEPENRFYIYYWSHTRIDSILFGCLLAVFNNPYTSDRVFIGGRLGYFILGCVLIVFTLIYRDPLFRETGRYTLQGIALFLVFNFLIRDSGVFSNILQVKPLKVVADYSYVLYLIHVPILKSCENVLLGFPTWLQYSTGFVLSSVSLLRPTALSNSL